MSGKFIQDPLNAAIPQGGFAPERGGNLRDHDGCYANPKAIAATTHYDGDYGTPQPKKDYVKESKSDKGASFSEVAADVIAGGVSAFNQMFNPPKEPKQKLDHRQSTRRTK